MKAEREVSALQDAAIAKIMEIANNFREKAGLPLENFFLEVRIIRPYPVVDGKYFANCETKASMGLFFSDEEDEDDE